MKLMVPDSPHHHEGLGSNAQNNGMSSTKISVNCFQPFPIQRLPNSFLHRFTHFIQFLVKSFYSKLTPTPPHLMRDEVNEHHFPVQVWIYHAMSSKKCKLTFTPFPCWVGIGEHIVQMWIFCSKTILGETDHALPPLQ